MSRAQEMPFRKLGDNASDDQSGSPPLDPNQPTNQSLAVLRRSDRSVVMPRREAMELSASFTLPPRGG